MEILEKIREASKTYKCTEPLDCRSMPIGQWVAQGDVQIERIAAPATVGEDFGTQQVVPGETKGARHVFDERAALYARIGEDELQGPVVHVKEEAILLHPEHRHCRFSEGWFSVTYQRDFAQEEIRRVRD